MKTMLVGFVLALLSLSVWAQENTLPAQNVEAPYYRPQENIQVFQVQGLNGVLRIKEVSGSVQLHNIEAETTSGERISIYNQKERLAHLDGRQLILEIRQPQASKIFINSEGWSRGQNTYDISFDAFQVEEKDYIEVFKNLDRTPGGSDYGNVEQLRLNAKSITLTALAKRIKIRGLELTLENGVRLTLSDFFKNTRNIDQYGNGFINEFSQEEPRSITIDFGSTLSITKYVVVAEGYGSDYTQLEVRFEVDENSLDQQGDYDNYNQDPNQQDDILRQQEEEERRRREAEEAERRRREEEEARRRAEQERQLQCQRDIVGFERQSLNCERSLISLDRDLMGQRRELVRLRKQRQDRNAELVQCQSKVQEFNGQAQTANNQKAQATTTLQTINQQISSTQSEINTINAAPKFKSYRCTVQGWTGTKFQATAPTRLHALRVALGKCHVQCRKRNKKVWNRKINDCVGIK